MNEKLLKVLSSTDERIAELTEELFSDNEYMQKIFIAYIKTMQCKLLGVKRSPDTFVPNLIGPAGKGKTSIINEFGARMETFLEEKFTIRKQPLSGLNDFADVIGVLHVKNDVSVLARSSNFPATDDQGLGILFLDDFNRAHGHILSAAMEFVNTFQFASYKLPPCWSVVAASNPDDGEYTVTGLDEAQYTRFVPIAYNPPIEVLLQQMEIQGSPSILKTLIAKAPDLFKEHSTLTMLPTPRPVNWRSFMIFSHMFSVCQHIPKLSQSLTLDMLGPGAYDHLNELSEEENPITLAAVLKGRFHQALQINVENSRFDMLSRANHEIVNHAKMGQASRETTDAVFAYAVELPDSFCTDLLRRLIDLPNYGPDWGLACFAWKQPSVHELGPLAEKLKTAQTNLATELLKEKHGIGDEDEGTVA